MRSIRLVSALTAGALLLTACGTSSGDESAPITAGTEAPAVISAPTGDADPAAPASAPADGDADANAAVVPTALQFSAPLVGGGDIDASSLAGKPTVFWFWAPT